MNTTLVETEDEVTFVPARHFRMNSAAFLRWSVAVVAVVGLVMSVLALTSERDHTAQLQSRIEILQRRLDDADDALKDQAAATKKQHEQMRRIAAVAVAAATEARTAERQEQRLEREMARTVAASSGTGVTAPSFGSAVVDTVKAKAATAAGMALWHWIGLALL